MKTARGVLADEGVARSMHRQRKPSRGFSHSTDGRIILEEASVHTQVERDNARPDR